MSQLQALCDKLGIKCEATYGGVEPPEGEWGRSAHPYKVTLKFGRRRLTTAFFMGPAHTKEPTAADVLSCLISDGNVGEESFEDFCNSLGYDVDSRRAEKTWRACVKMAPRVRRFLGDHFDAVANAEH